MRFSLETFLIMSGVERIMAKSSVLCAVICLDSRISPLSLLIELLLGTGGVKRLELKRKRFKLTLHALVLIVQHVRELLSFFFLMMTSKKQNLIDVLLQLILLQNSTLKE